MDELTITLTREQWNLIVDCMDADISTMEHMQRWNKDPALTDLIKRSSETLSAFILKVRPDK